VARYCCHAITSRKSPIWMHCRANFCAARVRRSFSFWIYSVVRNRALTLRLARLRQRAGGRSGFAGDLRRRQGWNIASPGGKRVATPVGGARPQEARAPHLSLCRWLHSSRDSCATRRADWHGKGLDSSQPDRVAGRFGLSRECEGQDIKLLKGVANDTRKRRTVYRGSWIRCML
jgi:hypothetical protein